MSSAVATIKGSDLTDAWQTASCDYPWTLRNFRA
jgi:hypothetical protein